MQLSITTITQSRLVRTWSETPWVRQAVSWLQEPQGSQLYHLFWTISLVP